jgi:signal peptidase I
MDVEQAPKTYPRWVGVLLVLFVPGSAHFFSGRRKTGLAWMLGLILFAFMGHGITAIPSTPMVILGLTLNFGVLVLLYLGMLVGSYRRVPRLRLRGWILFVALLLGLNLFAALIRATAPATPYRIPTGGMSPTLLGMRATTNQTPATVFSWPLQGYAHKEFRAQASGSFQPSRSNRENFAFEIGDTPHALPYYALDTFRPKTHYEKNDILWSGTLHAGDFIMVQRYSYLLLEPGRGDIVVFKTEGVDHPHMRKDTVYIKRIVGLPGETIRIDASGLVVNGITASAPPFNKLHYHNDGKLASPTDAIELGKDEYLVFGDNTLPNMSLDGRFFGAIPRSCIVGRATTIYWPFTRIGVIE